MPTESLDPAAHARNQLARMVREHELPGAQYVAIGADRTLLQVHLGTADVATGQRMQEPTLLMAYSITKVLTAIAVMQLVDAGKIDLDAPLSRYWPDHPYGTAITIRALLAHTAGVPNPLPLAWFALEGEPLARDAVLNKVLVKHAKLAGAPGAAYRYSNIGYWLLEKAIESASGRDYAHYVDQHVFEPLGIARDAATFELPPQQVMATGHVRRFTAMALVLRLMAPARYWTRSHDRWSRTARVQPHGRAYGGLFCSASALASIMQDLLRPQPTLLSARARDQMLTEQRTQAGKPTGNTLGWVAGELNGVRYFGKQGGGLGFHGNVRIYPALGVATVLLSNRTEISPGPIDARSDLLDAGFAR